MQNSKSEMFNFKKSILSSYSNDSASKKEEEKEEEEIDLNARIFSNYKYYINMMMVIYNNIT